MRVKDRDQLDCCPATREGVRVRVLLQKARSVQRDEPLQQRRQGTTEGVNAAECMLVVVRFLNRCQLSAFLDARANINPERFQFSCSKRYEVRACA